MKPSASSKNSHFQNEAKCKTFLLKMSFNLDEKKKSFFVLMPSHLASL